MKEDICLVLKEFHSHGRIPRGGNASFIALIPKVENPLDLGDFRPISLIGCLYKIMAKVLVKRLKRVMKFIIHESQMVFIGGRNIVVGVVIANEVVDEAKKKNKPILIFKADFEKAYDSVRWSFLYEVMERMGFCDKWIGWIRGCIETTTSSVLVNGSPTKEFPFERGLRQGDPLAPFLFLMVAEGLGGLVREAVEKNLFEGVQVGREELKISLLQFADDTLFFGEASLRNIITLKSILRCFELASRLKVNFFKSKVGGVA